MSSNFLRLLFSRFPRDCLSTSLISPVRLIPSAYSSSASRDYREFRSWQEIRKELLLLGNSIQTADLAEALNTLKRRMEPIPNSFLQEIQLLLLPRTGSLNSRQTSDLFHSCAKLKYYDGELITQLSREVLLGNCPVHELDNRGLSTIIYSLGQLQVLSNGNLMPREALEMVHLILKELQESYRMQYLEPRQISNVLYGLALLKVDLGDQNGVQYLVQLGCQEQNLSNFTEQGFCNFLYSLKELEIQLDHELQTQLISELLKNDRIENLSQQGLCNVMSSLKSIGIQDKKVLEVLAAASIHSSRLLLYNSQDLANLVHTISSWTVSNKAPVLNMFKNRILEMKNLAKMKEQELCVIIYCFAQSGLQELDSFYKLLGKEIIQQERLPLYTNQGLSMVIYSLGMAKYRDLVIWRALGREASKTDRLEIASNQSLANLVYGLGRLRLTGDSVLNTVYVKILKEAQKSHRLNSANEQYLANIIYSLAQLKLKQFLEAFLTEILQLKRLTKLSDQGLSNIFQALCWLGDTKPVHRKQLLEEAENRCRKTRLSEAAVLNFIHAGLSTEGWNQQLPPHSILRALLPKTQLASFTSDGLISILKRFVRIEFRERKYILPVLLELTNSENRELSVLQTAASLRLCWNLSLSRNQIIDRFVKLLMYNDQWQELSPDALAEVLVSLCWLKYPDHSLHSTLIRKLVHCLDQVESVKVLQILQGLQVSWIPVDLVESLVDHLCHEEKLLVFTVPQIVSLVQCQASFHLRDASRVLICIKEIVKPNRLNQLTLKDVAILLESLVLLDLKDLDQIETLVSILDNSKALEKIRVHYIAKMIISLTQLGQEYKSKTGKLVEWLVKSPNWSASIEEKDLMDILTTLKQADYEYGKIGGLLNQKRRQSQNYDFEDIAI